jgi:hypothetical protein
MLTHQFFGGGGGCGAHMGLYPRTQTCVAIAPSLSVPTPRSCGVIVVVAGSPEEVLQTTICLDDRVSDLA